MIEFYFGDNEYSFPNSWEELTQEQFLALLPYLEQYSEGSLSVSDVRALWFMDIAGLTGMKLNNKNKDFFAENIYRMAHEFTFIFDIEYPKGSLDNIDPELRKAVRKTPPEDMEQTPEVRYLSKLDYTYKIAACWCKNLIPSFEHKGKTYKAYTVDLNGKMLSTSLIASQYIAATEALSQFEKTNETLYLRLLAACLYSPNAKFDTDLVPGFADEFKKLPEGILFGILLNFQSIMTHFRTRTKWNMLWNRKADTDVKLSLGISESLYSLSQRGYCDYKNADTMPLLKFFDLMLKDIYDSVRMLKSHEVDLLDIAEKTGLSINQVKQIV